MQYRHSTHRPRAQFSSSSNVREHEEASRRIVRLLSSAQERLLIEFQYLSVSVSASVSPCVCVCVRECVRSCVYVVPKLPVVWCAGRRVPEGERMPKELESRERQAGGPSGVPRTPVIDEGEEDNA